MLNKTINMQIQDAEKALVTLHDLEKEHKKILKELTNINPVIKFIMVVKC